MEVKKTIGVLISTLDRYYQRQLWQSLEEEADKLGYRLLFFCGRPLDSNIYDEKENNVIYKLLNVEKLDGLISASGTLSNYIGSKKFKEFLDTYNKIPIVNLSVPIKGHCNITIDNYTSMKKILDHIFTTHHPSKLAYISGPKTNVEAIDRHRAVEDAVADYGLDEANYKVYYGDFTQDSARDALKIMIDQEAFIPDVLVCANDEMAIGSYFALRERGLKMPSQVSFTGFDDIDNATNIYPPFTTIKQPFAEMGIQAVRAADQLIKGLTWDEDVSFSGHLILRESCGCHQVIGGLSPLQQEEIRPNLRSDQLMDYREEIFVELIHILGEQRYNQGHENMFSKLLMALDQDLKDRCIQGEFLQLISSYMNDSTDNVIYHSIWIDVIYRFRMVVNKVEAFRCNQHLQDILYQAAILVQINIDRSDKREGFAFRADYYASSFMIQDMNQVTNEYEMFKVIAYYTKEYKFKDYYVCLFDQSIVNKGSDQFLYPESIRLAFGLSNGKQVDSLTFPSDNMLPSFLMEKDIHMVFYPLFFRNHHFGYIASDIAAVQTLSFRSLYYQICNALERVLLYDELESYNKRLEDLSTKDPLTGTYNRRGFYEAADSAYQVAKRKGQSILLVYGDLDELKIINDVYGHQEGDQAIKQISEFLVTCTKEDDIIGRIGGDEFVCLLKRSDFNDFQDMKKMITGKINEYNKQKLKPYSIDISLGASCFNPTEGLSLDALLKEADQDLYKNKRKKKLQKRMLQERMLQEKVGD